MTFDPQPEGGIALEDVRHPVQFVKGYGLYRGLGPYEEDPIRCPVDGIDQLAGYGRAPEITLHASYQRTFIVVVIDAVAVGIRCRAAFEIGGAFHVRALILVV